MKRFKFSPFPQSAIALVVVAVALVGASYLLPVDQTQQAMTPIPETLDGQGDGAALAGQEPGADGQGDVTSGPGGALEGATPALDPVGQNQQPAAKIEIVEEGNWSQQVPNPDQQDQEEGEPASFEEYRLKRAKSHAAAKEVLEEIVQDPATTAEMRTQAQQDLVALSKVTEQELTIENLLALRYECQAVVFISGSQATAVLHAATPPTEQGMALAAQLMAEYTGLAYENVVVLVMD